MPLPLLAEHTHAVADRVGRRVVLVCHSGVRAEQARQRLHEVGMDSSPPASSPGTSSPRSCASSSVPSVPA